MADASLAGSVALGLTGLSTIPALKVSVKRFLSRKRSRYEELEKLYEDEDGVATTVSQERFSTALSVYLLLGGTLLGQCVSIATAIQSTVQTTKDRYTQDWLAVASWVSFFHISYIFQLAHIDQVLLLFQAVTLFGERHPVKRFNGALINAAAFLVLIVCLLWQNIPWKSHSLGRNRSIPHLISTALELACATLSCLSCLLLPRRPSIFSNGQAVDGQFTVSTLNRWTFAWAGELLAFAKRNQGLDMAHLPQLHLRVRSRHLESAFYRKNRINTLWKDLLRAHWLELAGQSLLAMSQGIIQFAPQLAMYKLLELLEHRSEGEAIANEAWAWVVGLGLSIIITAWVEAFMHWVIWARMGSPIRSELSALIFSKSTRRKDVKGHQKVIFEENIGASGATEPVASGPNNQKRTQPDGPSPNPFEEEEEDEETQKSRQSVINLIGIDAKRISDFASCHWIFSQTVAKLGASIIFLVNLIGWRSLLAGFAFTALSLPFNIWASRSYSNTQTALMKARDRKMVVVTEALQGIRQIKFSALEPQWQAKIGKKRAEELRMQWKAFAVNTVLIGIWILGPVMLSAVSLAVFAVLNGDLSPSIAFTTIAVFSQIEMAMAIIPELTSDGLGKPYPVSMHSAIRGLTICTRGVGQHEEDRGIPKRT